jgi:hypothetical protein
MMHAHGTLKRTDADFLAQARNINQQCHEHATAWDIDPHRLADFDRLLANAAGTYEANSDPATRNATTSANKREAFGELRHFIGMYVNYLEGNIKVPESALKSMELRPRRRPGYKPLPRPTGQPAILIRRQHDEITVYVFQPTHGQPADSVGESSTHCFMLRHKKEGEAEWHTVVSSRLHCTLFFNREDEGTSVTLSAAWMNPRFETGPWSDEIQAVIG